MSPLKQSTTVHRSMNEVRKPRQDAHKEVSNTEEQLGDINDIGAKD